MWVECYIFFLSLLLFAMLFTFVALSVYQENDDDGDMKPAEKSKNI